MSLPTSWLSKIVRFLVVLLLVSSVLTPQKIHAQDYSSSLNPDVPRNDHTRAQVVIIEVTAALICQLTGHDLINPEKGCLGIDPETNKIGYVQQQNSSQSLGGLLGFSSNMISSLYSPPVTSGEYIRYMANNFGVGPKTYAANGTEGFNSLESLRSIWISMRNIAYLVFTLLFIIIGIAIMLRVKIDPRTVMSIQNQIPKIIVTIVLVTFSYAIVGAMIDLMWTVTYAGINILTSNVRVDVDQDDLLILDTNSSAGQALAAKGVNVDELVRISQEREGQLREIWESQGATQEEIDKRIQERVETTNDAVDDLTNRVDGTTGKELENEQIIEYVNQTWNNNKSVREVATANLNSTPLSYVSRLFSEAGGFGRFDGISGISYKVGITIGDVISQTLASLLGLDRDSGCGAWPWQWTSCADDVFFGILKWIVGAVAFLIVAVAIFIALIRVWFSLLRALVYIIIYTIVGPLMIVAGIIPGSSINFSRWFRALLAHLLIFPVTVFVFLLARIMAANNDLNNPTGTTFLPPLIANPNSFNNLGILIAFGLILIAPELLSFVRDAVKAKPGPVGGILAKGFGAGVGPGTAIPRFMWRESTQPWNLQTGQSAGFLRNWVTGGNNPRRWQRAARYVVGGVKPTPGGGRS